jgi:mitochondrial fission protein ELM1
MTAHMTLTDSMWLLTDDRPGNAAQVLGVAEALGLAYVRKEIRYTALGKLPNIVRASTLMGVTDDTAAQLGAPWPDLVISAGRRTAPVARWIRKVADKPVRLVHIMNPGVAGAADFDLIAVPNHDCEKPDGDASNVLRITGAPHRFSAARLAAEAEEWESKLAHLPRPFIALLVGGATRQRPFPAELAKDLGTQVNAMARATGGSVLLSTSRRTGAEAEIALLAALDTPRHAYLWGQERNNTAPNPYGGYLALADMIVVTGDSVSMCSEACAGSSAAYIYAPQGMVAPKHARLHDELYRLGLAKPFTGVYEPFAHPPLNAAEAVAARIEKLLVP